MSSWENEKQEKQEETEIPTVRFRVKDLEKAFEQIEMEIKKLFPLKIQIENETEKLLQI